MIRKTYGLAALLAAVSFLAPAEGAEVEGYLMDTMCSMKALKEGQKAAAMHTRDCALMPDCVKSGFGVVTADGKYLKFDAAGNQTAEKQLRKTKKKDNLKVQVSGNVDGESIEVKKLKLL